MYFVEGRHLLEDLVEGVLEELAILALCLLISVGLDHGVEVVRDERLHFVVQLVVVVYDAKDEVVATVLNVQFFDNVVARQIGQAVDFVFFGYFVDVLGERF